jgi:ribose transport system substrate-binding protein
MRSLRMTRLAALAVTAAAALALSACVGGTPGSTHGSGGGDTKVGVALLIPNQNDYANAFVDGATASADKDGNAAITTFVANFDPQLQLSQCQDAITSRKYKALVIEPVDGVNMGMCAEDAVAAGLAVVAIAVPIGPRNDTIEPQIKGLTATVAVSAKDYGVAAADSVVAACAGINPCKVGYLYGTKGFAYDTTRRKAADDIFAGHPNIKIVAEGESKFDQTTTINVVTDMMRAHPDLDVLLSVQDPVPVIAGLDSVGALGKVKLYASGSSDAAIKTVVDGKTDGLTVLMPRSEALRGTQIAIDAARGKAPERNAINPWTDLSSVGPSGQVTKKNAAGFPHQFVGG